MKQNKNSLDIQILQEWAKLTSSEKEAVLYHLLLRDTNLSSNIDFSSAVARDSQPSNSSSKLTVEAS